jgi:FtsP/CotA-like multicopper oxidase with cupredoxin domain
MPVKISRRSALLGLASASLAAGARAAEGEALDLRSTSLKLAGEEAAATQLWTLGGGPPGRLLRARVGEPFALSLTNRLDQMTAFHWQGLRLPNRMDGLEIAAGATTDIRFTPREAGTYWCRPALWPSAAEQKARGLYALLIVEGPGEAEVDRDLPMIFDDWRLDEAGQIKGPFPDLPDLRAEGRIGQLLTVNHRKAPASISGRPGERLRLRMLNACSARLIGVLFENIRAQVISIDGHSCEPFEPARDTLPMGPGARFDVIVDLPAEGEGRIWSRGGGLRREKGGEPDQPLILLKGEGSPRSSRGPVMSRGNPQLPEQMRLQKAKRVEIAITTTGRNDPQGFWGFNAAPGDGTNRQALFKVEEEDIVTLAFTNRSPVPHSIHVQGHVMRVLHPLDDGWEPYWRDSVIVPPGRTVRTAFVADNPGRWLIESTILDYAAAGLVGWFEVG